MLVFCFVGSSEENEYRFIECRFRVCAKGNRSLERLDRQLASPFVSGHNRRDRRRNDYFLLLFIKPSERPLPGSKRPPIKTSGPHSRRVISATRRIVVVYNKTQSALPRPKPRTVVSSATSSFARDIFDKSIVFRTARVRQNRYDDNNNQPYRVYCDATKRRTFFLYSEPRRINKPSSVFVLLLLYARVQNRIRTTYGAWRDRCPGTADGRGGGVIIISGFFFLFVPPNVFPGDRIVVIFPREIYKFYNIRRTRFFVSLGYREYQKKKKISAYLIVRFLSPPYLLLT